MISESDTEVMDLQYIIKDKEEKITGKLYSNTISLCSFYFAIAVVITCLYIIYHIHYRCLW